MKKWVQSTTYSSIGFKWADEATYTRVGYSSEFSVCAVDVGILWSIRLQVQVSPLGESEYAQNYLVM